MKPYIYDEAGRIRNLGAIDYKIPTTLDQPLECDIVENEDGPGPCGSKGSEGAEARTP